jgi:predicted ferric reductase
VHAAAWSVALSLRPGLMPTRQIAAEVLSTLAVVCMCVNLVLATRSRLIERRMFGLDKVFVSHRTIGLTVAVIVTTHFLLVPKTVGWVPSKYVGYPMIVLLLTMVFVASAPRFPWRRLVPLKYQTWKLTHRFNGLFVALATTHSLFAHTYVKLVPGLAAYVYGVATIGFGAWIYRELLFNHHRPPEIHEIESFKHISDDLSEVVLKTPMQTARTSGQFAFLSLGGGPTPEQHPFTISSPADDHVRFSIKASGDFTRELAEARLQLTSKAAVEGPYGAFVSRRGRRQQLWLAGGIGITPFLAMAADIDAETNVLLIWSVHDLGDAMYRDELHYWASVRPSLRFDLHVSTERGHFDASRLELAASPSDYSAFICGPVPMRVALAKDLRRRGLARSEIYFEEFRLR